MSGLIQRAVNRIRRIRRGPRTKPPLTHDDPIIQQVIENLGITGFFWQMPEYHDDFSQDLLAEQWYRFPLVVIFCDDPEGYSHELTVNYVRVALHLDRILPHDHPAFEQYAQTACRIIGEITRATIKDYCDKLGVPPSVAFATHAACDLTAVAERIHASPPGTIWQWTFGPRWGQDKGGEIVICREHLLLSDPDHGSELVHFDPRTDRLEISTTPGHCATCRSNEQYQRAS